MGIRLPRRNNNALLVGRRNRRFEMHDAGGDDDPRERIARQSVGFDGYVGKCV